MPDYRAEYGHLAAAGAVASATERVPVPVLIRVGNSGARMVGAITEPGGLPALLRLVADEIEAITRE